MGIAFQKDSQTIKEMRKKDQWSESIKANQSQTYRLNPVRFQWGITGDEGADGTDWADVAEMGNMALPMNTLIFFTALDIRNSKIKHMIGFGSLML